MMDANLPLEEGSRLLIPWDKKPLVPCIVQCLTTREVLMLAYMNEQALTKTLESGLMHYWSRSRQSLWLKGESSGQLQRWHDIRLDCDQDTLLALVSVEGDGGCCHTGRKTCFYRNLEVGQNSEIILKRVD